MLLVGGKHELRESFGDTAYEVMTMVVMTVEITAVSTAVSTAVVQQTAKVVSGTLANKLLRSGSVVEDALNASFLSKVDDVKYCPMNESQLDASIAVNFRSSKYTKDVLMGY